jgi:FMN phosphatase YigB (HAD superfamily)
MDLVGGEMVTFFNIMDRLDGIKVVSFDAEGTLVTPDFSYSIWYEAIPEKYAEKKGIDFETARKIVEEEYSKVGDQRLEWYDVRYWFRKFSLGSPEAVLESYRHRVCYYPEVRDVVTELSGRYMLIVASGSMREFLRHLLQDIEPCFSRVFSSLSDYRQLKTPEFYLQICRVMGVRPEEVTHVGDNRDFDFIAPQKVGIRAFHLDRKGEHDNALTSLRELTVRL